MPYVAAMHGDIFYPTFLLRMILPTDVAMTWGYIIHFFLAGLFTYGFLRAIGYGFYGALVGGIAYMMSGQIAVIRVAGTRRQTVCQRAVSVGPLDASPRHPGRAKSGAGARSRWSSDLCTLAPHPQLLAVHAARVRRVCAVSGVRVV